jgi:prepilin-type processing-associated H-X9-DG protein/prepilin-type N-terminal cleavage/methylation domain-containing protein
MFRANASFDPVPGTGRPDPPEGASQFPRQIALRRRKGGFTLIEVLVVVGIMALLIAILLPSLGTARKVAQATACGAQLEQISVGILMYTQAYKDVLPHLGYRPDPDRILWSWFTQIAPYVRNQFAMYVCPTDDGPDKNTVILRNGKIRMARTNEPGTILPVTYRGSCDALDDGNVWTIDGVKVGTMPRKITAFRRPSVSILLTEGWPVTQSGQNCLRFDQMVHLLDSVLFPSAQYMRSLNSFRRHNGRSNFVFADGHVGRHTLDEACRKLPYQQQFRYKSPGTPDIGQ